MKILFITSRFPLPPYRGDQVRAYHFLRILNHRHNVYLLSPIHRKSCTFNNINKICKEATYYNLSFMQVFINVFNYLINGDPIQNAFFYGHSVAQEVRKIVEKKKIDLVHVQTARLGNIGYFIPEYVPKVLDFIDALSLNMHRRSLNEHWIKKTFFEIESKRFANYERKMVRLFDRQIITSIIDKIAIGDYNTLHVIPNGVDIESFSFSTGIRNNKIILFTGRMAYFPNAEAAIYFAKKVFPLIKKVIKEAQFFIVGTDPPIKVRKLGEIDGVKVTGHVPNIYKYLSECAVFVAPLLSGSGIQNKVLEAMASGIPTVLTHHAVGAIKAFHGIHCLVGTGETELAEHVIKVMQDKQLGKQLAIEARKLIENEYSWNRSVEMLENVYRLATEQKSHIEKSL